MRIQPYLAVLATSLTLMVTRTALAQKHKQTNAADLQYPPPVDTTGSTEARKKLQTAKSDLTKAEQALGKVVEKLRKDFEASPDRSAVVAQARAARGEFDSLAKPVLDVLHASPQFRALNAQREDVDAKLSSTDGDTDIRVQLAQQRLALNKKSAELESEALKSDPKLLQAKQKFSDLGSKLADQFAKFQQSLKSDPQWEAAKQDLDQAKANRDSAAKDLDTALAKEADEEKQRQQQIAKIDQERLNALEHPTGADDGSARRRR